MDNAQSLWDKIVGGISVKNPAEIDEMAADTRYVVANKNHADEIVNQLKSSVTEGQILVY